MIPFRHSIVRTCAWWAPYVCGCEYPLNYVHGSCVLPMGVKSSDNNMLSYNKGLSSFIYGSDYIRIMRISVDYIFSILIIY